jgi:hypothetical protein
MCSGSSPLYARPAVNCWSHQIGPWRRGAPRVHRVPPPDDVVRQAAQPGRPQVTVERRSELARTAGGKLKLVIADPAFRPVRTTTLLRRD